MINVTTSLEVSTLGRFEVRRKHDLLTGGNWSRRKVVDLFKLLLSVEQHRLHREQVQEILWPTSTAEQAANSFGKTLYLLRRALEPDLAAGKGSSSIYVLLDHDTLMLVPDSMKIDADVFESSTKQLQIKIRSRSGKESESQNDILLDEFDHVLALYRGDYLPEDLYEDWTQRRRDRLRRIHSWLLENAAELALASGEGGGKGLRASEYLLELLERNSADEQTHRQLMLVYARMGRRSDALNQYLLLRKALKEELRAAPLPETNELFRRIQIGQVPVDLREPRLGLESRSTPSPNITEASSAATYLERTLPPRQDSLSGGQITRPTPVMPGISVGAGLDPPSPGGQVTLTPGQIDPDRILKAELVGREEEIARMQHALSQARNGQKRVIFASGEPGIGKSRLAAEFTLWSEGAHHAIVLWGYCYEMGGMLPYQAIADTINAHARTCSPEKLRSLLGNSAVDLAKIATEIRLKLPELPQPEPLGPEVERRNLYDAVARYFNALAAERPLIIIQDDLQWADAATLHLLNFLTLQSTGVSPFDSPGSANKGAAVPLYLLLYRADEVHEAHLLRGLIAALARAGIGEELRLQRLSEEQVLRLLVNMAGHSFHPTFASEIYRHTEGNPFFIGEVIRSLILEGKFIWARDHWQSTVKASELEIPQSVRLLIERRLLHLSPDCRTTLTLAAVLGREFSSALLCQARNLSEEVVAEHIDNAIQIQILASLDVRRGRLIAPTADLSAMPLADLTFTHDKIREVLYQWLNPLRRRTLHRQVAQAIEARRGDPSRSPAAGLQPYYSTLAYHYQMAEEPGQAVEYLLKAAYQASSVYAFIDAANYMKTALDLLIGDAERPRRAELLHQLANIYLYTGRMDDAMQAGLASCVLWRDLGNQLKEAETSLDVAFLSHWQGRESEAIKYIQSALQCIDAAPSVGADLSRPPPIYRPEETALLAKAYTQWGLAATVMGETPEALNKLPQADALHTKIGGNDPFITVVSLWARAWCAFLAETPRQMLTYALHGVEACHTSNKPDWEPMMNYSAAWAYMLLGQIAEGEQAARAALENAEQHGVVGAMGWANLVLAFLAIQAGHWEEARQYGDSAYAIATMLHDVDLQARVLWSRSVCAGWQGDWERAIADILAALQMGQQEGETSMVYPYLLVQAARAYFHAGKPEEAQAYLDQGIQFAQGRQYRQLPAIAERLQGRILQAQGRFEEAQSYFERSLAGLLALDDVVEHARTEESYGLFYVARDQDGDIERGQELIKRAQTTFRRLGVNG